MTGKLEPWWKDDLPVASDYRLADIPMSTPEDGAAFPLRWYWANFRNIAVSLRIIRLRSEWAVGRIAHVGPYGAVYALALWFVAFEVAFEGEAIPRAGPWFDRLSTRYSEMKDEDV